MVACYSLTTTLFLYWLTDRWSARRQARGVAGRSRFLSLLSDASFGIYLIHAFILTRVLGDVAPRLPLGWPVAVRVALLWLLVAGGSAAISCLLLYTPLLSRLVGRPGALPRGWPRRLLALFRPARPAPAAAAGAAHPVFAPPGESGLGEVARLESASD